MLAGDSTTNALVTCFKAAFKNTPMSTKASYLPMRGREYEFIVDKVDFKIKEVMAP